MLLLGMLRPSRGRRRLCLLLRPELGGSALVSPPEASCARAAVPPLLARVAMHLVRWVDSRPPDLRRYCARRRVLLQRRRVLLQLALQKDTVRWAGLQTWPVVRRGADVRSMRMLAAPVVAKLHQV